MEVRAVVINELHGGEFRWHMGSNETLIVFFETIQEKTFAQFLWQLQSTCNESCMLFSLRTVFTLIVEIVGLR